MKRIEVKSSQVKSVGYDAEKKILEVEFLNRKEPTKPGPVYQYSGFSEADWALFRQQESIGGYLNRHIKPNFACSKIEPEEAPDVQEKPEMEEGPEAA
jgi:KTSC domain